MQATREKPVIPGDASFLAFVREAKVFEFLWHLHAEYELTFIDRGHGRRLVGDHVSTFGAGDLVLLGPNLPHTWISQSNNGRDSIQRAVVIQFEREFLGNSFFARPELRNIDRLLQRAQHGLQFLGAGRDRAARQLLELPQQTGLSRLLTLIRVLDGLARTRHVKPLSSAGFSPTVRQGDDARIKRFCDHVERDLTEPLSLGGVAAHMHMSPRTLTRFLKRTLGMTLVDYLNELRIGHACAQLINTPFTVNEICFKVGFRNLSHFNRKFYAIKKCTPREFRRAHES